MQYDNQMSRKVIIKNRDLPEAMRNAQAARIRRFRIREKGNVTKLSLTTGLQHSPLEHLLNIKE